MAGERREKGELFHGYSFRFARWKTSGDLFGNKANILNTTKLYTESYVFFTIFFFKHEANCISISKYAPWFCTFVSLNSSFLFLHLVMEINQQMSFSRKMGSSLNNRGHSLQIEMKSFDNNISLQSFKYPVPKKTQKNPTNLLSRILTNEQLLSGLFFRIPYYL